MQSFTEILKRELGKPVQLKNGNGATIDPMEAMVKSVLTNAMKGDLASIAFIHNMTKDSDPEREKETQQKHRERVDAIAEQLTKQLKGEKAYDGQDVEIREVAEIKAFVEELTEMMEAPDFQKVSTDMKTGHQTISPIIALRDKQRELFQAQLAKLRQESMQRIIIRKQLKI